MHVERNEQRPAWRKLSTNCNEQTHTLSLTSEMGTPQRFVAGTTEQQINSFRNKRGGPCRSPTGRYAHDPKEPTLSLFLSPPRDRHKRLESKTSTRPSSRTTKEGSSFTKDTKHAEKNLSPTRPCSPLFAPKPPWPRLLRQRHPPNRRALLQPQPPPPRQSQGGKGSPWLL